MQADIVDVTWARVDDGFYVGSRDGAFLGCIDVLPDGSFAALDALTRPISTHPQLDDLDAADDRDGVVRAVRELSL